MRDKSSRGHMLRAKFSLLLLCNMLCDLTRMKERMHVTGHMQAIQPNSKSPPARRKVHCMGDEALIENRTDGVVATLHYLYGRPEELVPQRVPSTAVLVADTE